MDYFKSQLDRIQQQLGGLSASQKMLTASLVAIMVMTLVWWGRYAGNAELTPIFDTSLTASEAGNIERHLRGANIPVTVTGDRVMVPTDRRDEAIAILSIENALPSESNDAFDAMFAKLSPFATNASSAAAMLNAKQKSLSDILRTFPGVRSARVAITPKSATRLGGGSQATAFAYLQMKNPGESLGAKEVQGAALLVARAEPGLKPAQVTVLIDGRPQRIKDPDDPMSLGMSGEFAEIKAAYEKQYEDKIDEKLLYITGRIVSVSARIENTTLQTQSRKVDADKSLQKEIRTETGNTESTDPTPAAGEPGVGANTGPGGSVANAIPGGSAITTTEKTEFIVIPDETIETRSTPAGALTIVGATVQLPRSHFAAVARQQKGSAGEPTEAEITAVAEPMMTDVRNFVMRTCDIKEESAVYVSMYNDVVPMLAAAVAEVPEPSVVTATITGHVKEIAVGALAVISLFMLMMMVRKGGGAPLVIPASEPQVPQSLDTMGELAGIVGDGDPMLDGMELDEDAVKAQHMLGQVQNMVKENPEGAANLVKRWLNRT